MPETNARELRDGSCVLSAREAPLTSTTLAVSAEDPPDVERGASA